MINSSRLVQIEFGIGALLLLPFGPFAAFGRCTLFIFMLFVLPNSLVGQIQEPICGGVHTIMFESSPECPEELVLVFQDDFSTNGSPDLSKWVVKDGLLRNRDKELQCYKPENVIQQNDNLVIEATIDVMNDCYDHEIGTGVYTKYKSGEIESRDRFRYGYYEARVFLPVLSPFVSETGGIAYPETWPAFWIYGQEP